jgi:transketolase
VRKVFIETILDYSNNNKTPFLLTGDLGYSVLEPFKEKYPDSFINVGIMEQSMMSIAAGISSQNRKVFAYSISNFSTFRALEQLRLDIGYHNLDVCVVGVGTGFQYGSAGYSHWAVEDLAVVSALEKFRIFSPADANSTKNTVLDFLNNGGPTYIRLGKYTKNLSEICDYEEIEVHVRIFGKGKKVILSHGSITTKILESGFFNTNDYSLLVFDEIPAIINKLYLKIFEKATSIRVLEDVVYTGSLGSRVTRFIIENNLNTPFKWIGVSGINIRSAGGSEDYLRSRELGFNYLEDLFKD